MGRVVVEVMPKPAILDPQGQAVQAALGRLGFAGVTGVRQGKRFEVEIDGELTADRLADLRHAAETVLANTVIEDFAVRVGDGSDAVDPADPGSVDPADAVDPAGAVDAGA